MIVLAIIKLFLWAVVCQGGELSRVSSAVILGIVLGGIFATMDLAMFHFYLGAEEDLLLPAIALFLGHGIAVSVCAFFYHRIEDTFYSLLSVGVGAGSIVLIIPYYCFNAFVG